MLDSTPTVEKGESSTKVLSADQLAKQVKLAEEQAYYHYRLHRKDVDGALHEEGEYILRRGTRNDPDGFTLSVRSKGQVRHFPIHWTTKGLCCFENECAANIPNLIHRHIKDQAPVTARSGAMLLKVRPRYYWELLDNEVELGRKLGMGAFGSVFQAMLKREDEEQICAVKTLDSVSKTAEGGKQLKIAREDMLSEARTMRELSGHPNLVRAFGITVDTEVPSAVMEFMSGGSLEKRLRGALPLSQKTKVKICLEVARGVSYIGRLGYVHRDLAARNCLFETLNNSEVGIVKISDFGLTRKLDDTGCFKGPPDEKIPIVWTAYESLLHGQWFAKSDVWALGVVIWEVFSNGAKPYNELLELDKAAISKHLQEGNRLKAQENMNMPPGVARVMEECMITNVTIRPPSYYVCYKLQDELVALLG